MRPEELVSGLSGHYKLVLVLIDIWSSFTDFGDTSLQRAAILLYLCLDDYMRRLEMTPEMQRFAPAT